MMLAENMTEPELISVRPGSLDELQMKVSGRSDIVSSKREDKVIHYVIENGKSTYYFTEPGHIAHPSAMFRGWAKRSNGQSGFDQRAWSSSDNKSDFIHWARQLANLPLTSP